MNAPSPVGNLLRQWRQRRRLSQLDFACEAEISSKHLSFLETGRSLPSREMLIRLAELLEIPLRERNVMLIAAGYAPLFPQRSLDHPDLEVARAAVERLLSAMEPYPALAIDRYWNLLASNEAVTALLTGVHHSLLTPPINVLRLSLHPQGIAPRIVNLSEWRAHLLARLRHQIDVCGDALLGELLDELTHYPGSSPTTHASASAHTVAVPLRLAHEGAVLSFISTTTVFGTPVDVTLSEMALECFYPADAKTAQLLQAAARAQPTDADANKS
jgi:transcriptional regulator with XRE-family HTH domain